MPSLLNVDPEVLAGMGRRNQGFTMPASSAPPGIPRDQDQPGLPPVDPRISPSRPGRPGWEAALQNASQSRDPAILNRILAEYWDQIPSHVRDLYTKAGFGPTGGPGGTKEETYPREGVIPPRATEAVAGVYTGLTKPRDRIASMGGGGFGRLPKIGMVAGEGGQLGRLQALQKQEQAGLLPMQAYEKMLQELGIERQEKTTRLGAEMGEAQISRQEREFKFKQSLNALQMEDLQRQVGSIFGNYLLSGLGQAVGTGIQMYGRHLYGQQTPDLPNPPQYPGYVGMQVGASYPPPQYGYGGMGYWGGGG